jgi:YNFM family putative membrane transporter
LARPRAFPVVLAGFTAFLDLYATQPLLPLLMRVFQTSHVAVSLTVTAATVAVAIAAPVVGRLGDLMGRKRVIVLSAFTLAAVTALVATATSLSQFVAWRFVQGLVTPGVFAITIAYIHDEWPASHAARGTAAYVSGTVIGGFCGRALTGLVADRAGWPTAFVVLAGVNLAAACAIAAWLPRESSIPHPRQAGHVRSIAGLLKNRQLVATDAVGFCVLFSQVAVFSYVTFHLSAEPFHLGTAALGWLFVVYLVGAIVTPLAGRWIDVRGHRTGLAAAMVVGIFGALLTLTPWLGVIVVGLALVSTGVFTAQATASSYIGSVTDRDRGLAVGLYSSCYYAGGSLGAVLPAVFWTAGGWTACVLLVIAVQVATGVVAMRFWRDVRSPAEPLPEGIS